jgi:hypothetical protein
LERSWGTDICQFSNVLNGPGNPPVLKSARNLNFRTSIGY